jgi:CheY-like chemotaxis protein
LDDVSTEDGIAEAHGVPEDFVLLVRDAMVHLYDHAHLQPHPLTRLVPGSSDPIYDSAAALRHLLLEALEQLNPGAGVSRNDKRWRPYGILVRRYVDGFPVKEIRRQMHISLRQLQREHRKGLVALASILWRQWQPETQGAIQATTTDELRQEVERLGLALESCDLGLLVESILGPAQAVARNNQVQLQAMPPRRPVAAWIDLVLSKQALLGALSALIPGGTRWINITWASSRGNALIDLEVYPPLPNDSSRAACERRERLLASAELIRAQGGELRLLDTEKGTTGISISLRKAGGAHVLLVDDNERILQLFGRYLAAGGYTATGATSAETALQAIEQELPEAIILDIMMRNVDGWQLLQRLRVDPHLADVPIIVCSVLKEPEIALALGAQYYLKKPVSQQQMLAALQQVLGSNSSGTLHRVEP